MGRGRAAGDFHDLEDARGRNVLVVGYGRSSCDVSAPISDVAAGTDLVAGELLGKMPRKLGGVVNHKCLMLTRTGEGLFRYLRPHGVERFPHGPGDAVRRRMPGSVRSATSQLRLEQLGLVPNGSFEDIARSTVSLATDDSTSGSPPAASGCTATAWWSACRRRTAGRTPSCPAARSCPPT